MTVVRDLLLLVAPGIAFIIEALKKQPSVELLILYMAFMSTPGIAGALFLARNGGPPPSDTVPPPSESPPPLSSQPGPSSSPSSSSGT
jgi:hypothetical protein